MDTKNPNKSSLDIPPEGRTSLGRDPRSSSTQSLVPSITDRGRADRRTLLIIYVHGFMGNDNSFQSFPAHVHKYLRLALSDTHVIHSKIYPKYKTYKTIEVARDNFSSWLEPHESPKTDVVLVGHSMGGLLAADVVLMPSPDHYHHRHFKHRILGAVHLDAPVLGLHPGIIVAGISSLFRKNEPPKPVGDSQPESSQSPSGIASPNSPNPSLYSQPSITSQTSLPSIAPPLRPAFTFDPNFNPVFPNDIRLQDRGWWGNVVHFVKKHNSEGLINAASNHIMSHLEFGGCMMDINGLKRRYENVRKLEDIDDIKHYGFPHVPPQVRFIQYYTVCYGVPKKPKLQIDNENTDLERFQSDGPISPGASTPRMAIQNASSGSTHSVPLRSIHKEDMNLLDSPISERSSLELLSPDPMPDDEHPTPEASASDDRTDQHHDIQSEPPDTKENFSSIAANSATGEESNLSSPVAQTSEISAEATTELSNAVNAMDLDLPPIAELPPKPEPPDLDKYTDKDTRKQVEKEAKRAQKAYEQAVKQREKQLKERQKIVEKRQKKRLQEAEKQAKEAEKQRLKSVAEGKTVASERAVPASEPSTSLTESVSNHPTDEPPSYDTVVASSQEQDPSDDGYDIHLEVARQRESAVDGSNKQETQGQKKKRERKFCTLPSKVNGQVDPKWIKVFMKDMDEVTAHTSLFFAGEHYEKLVGDVGDTIIEWVQADLTKRAILEMQ